MFIFFSTMFTLLTCAIAHRNKCIHLSMTILFVVYYWLHVGLFYALIKGEL